MTNPAPVVIFTYNRPEHLRQILFSLKTNKECGNTSLYLFSDGPKNPGDEQRVAEVRQIIREAEGFKEVHIVEQPHNKGLAASIIQGVSEVLSQNPACIVLEDDLVVSRWFLQFMNQGLEHYCNHPDIFSISGYCPPIAIPEDYPHEAFRFGRINSWGWATWADRWQSIDWKVSDFEAFIRDKNSIRMLQRLGKDLPVMLLKQQVEEISSWAVRFNQACFRSGGTNIYPVQSLVVNSGADGTGTHMKASRKFRAEMTRHALSPQPAEEQPEINRAFRKFYEPSLYRRIINWTKIKRHIQKKVL